jgi:hypothetical protein
VFENRVLRRIFGLKRDEVTGGWRKLHNEELHNLYSPPNTIRIIKLRRMRWAGHTWEGIEMYVRYWWESQREGNVQAITEWLEVMRLSITTCYLRV